MATVKRLLIISDLTETLLYLKKKTRSITTNVIDLDSKIKFDDVVPPYHVRYRADKQTFLEELFKANSQVEMGVWSSLPHNDTLELSTNFFGRYYRRLLFAISTRREEYEGKAAKENFQSLAIKKDLSQIFERFPQFSEANTIVLTAQPNLIEKYQPNDLIVPRYNPYAMPLSFEQDPGLAAVRKYISGTLQLMKKNQVEDVRGIIRVKSVKMLFERVQHHAFTQRQYR